MATTLEGLFNTFCSFGAGKTETFEMDGAKFAKLCRDTGIFDKVFTSTDADLIFVKCKPAGERKIDYQTFREVVLPLIAERKGVAVKDLIVAMKQVGGPSIKSTKSEGQLLKVKVSSVQVPGQKLHKSSSAYLAKKKKKKSPKGSLLAVPSQGFGTSQSSCLSVTDSLGESCSSISPYESDGDSEEDVEAETSAHTVLLSPQSAIAGVYNAVPIEVKGSGSYTDHFLAATPPSAPPSPMGTASSPTPIEGGLLDTDPLNSPAGVSGGRSRYAALGAAGRQSSNRMDDGIAEAYTAPTAHAASKCFFPEGYVPGMDIRQFFDSLPIARYPRPLVIQMFQDFEHEMKRQLMVLNEQKAALTPNDVLALFGYSYEFMTSLEPKVNHPHQMYREMNSAMRGGGPELDFWRPFIFHLDVALQKLGSHREKLYRGITVSFPAEVYEPGKEVVWAAFSSSSLDIKVARNFMRGKHDAEAPVGTVFIINTHFAHRVYVYSHFPEEREVLFPPLSRFVVKNRLTADAKQLLGLPYDIIELEQLESP